MALNPQLHTRLYRCAVCGSCWVAAAAAGTIAYACVTPDGDDGVTFSPASDVEASLTYEISQVYVYSARAEKFLPLAPKCGDAFINLPVNKAKRTLTSSYVVENKYKACRMKF